MTSNKVNNIYTTRTNISHFQMKKYIILDVDSTLIYAVNNEKLKTIQDNIASISHKYKLINVVDADDTLPKATGEITTFALFFRPHVFEFLQTLAHKFHVIIWSAGTKHYIDKIIEILYKDIEPKPIAVFTRKFCEPVQIKQYRETFTIYKKPLKKIYECFSKLKIDVNKRNAVIVDDNPNGISDSDLDNHLKIPPFEYISLDSRVLSASSFLSEFNEPDENLQKIKHLLISDAFRLSPDVTELKDTFRNIFSKSVSEIKNKFKVSQTNRFEIGNSDVNVYQ